MNAKWMFDARKIPDEVMSYLRRIAVRAIEEKGYSPELVADFLGIDRTSICDWLRKYRSEGEESLDTRRAPGAERVMTPDIDQWLKKGSSRIHVELSETNQDSLLKIDEVPKAVTHAFHCLDRIVDPFDDARGHPMSEVV